MVPPAGGVLAWSVAQTSLCHTWGDDNDDGAKDVHTMKNLKIKKEWAQCRLVGALDTHMLTALVNSQSLFDSKHSAGLKINNCCMWQEEMEEP